MEKSDIELCIIVHHEKNVTMLRAVCDNASKQTIPWTVSVFYDSPTPADELDLLRSYHFDNYILTPPEIDTDPAARHKYAYDRSQAIYVAFCQGDDPSFRNRIEMQVESLKKHQVGISCGAYFYCENGDEATYRLCQFSPNDKYGFNVGYPSFWMLNKHIVVSLPVPEPPDEHGFRVPWEWEWDIFVLLDIVRKYGVTMMDQPVGVYNNHSDNSSNTHIKKEIKDQRFLDLIRYYAKIRGRNM